MILGRRVTWKHMKDGKPVLAFSGEVESVQALGTGGFRVLVQTDNGELMSQDAADLRVVSDDEVAQSQFEGGELGKESGFTANELEGALGLVDMTVRESGFFDAASEACEGGTNDIQSRARWLILELTKELKEAAETHDADEEKIAALIRERDAAESDPGATMDNLKEKLGLKKAKKKSTEGGQDA